MKKFEFVDITTADVAFVAYGRTLEELFENAGIALFEVMTNTAKVGKKISKKIEVEGFDLESLLFNWLNELLYYYSSENLFFSSFRVKIKESYKLEALAEGEEIDLNRHELKIEVKAATYHKMKVWRENGLWKARVILDI